jgi:flagellar hook-associated protein 3 FlgL
VVLSDGQVSSNVSYNSKFRSGEPYKVEFASGTQLKITDSTGKDVTNEATQGGAIDPTSKTAQTISFRGVDLSLNLNMQAGDVPDTVLKGNYEFTLAAKPDSFTGTRSPSNTSSEQLTGSTITDPAAYHASFPSGSAIVKFTTAPNFDVYAAPMTADSKPVSSGTMVGNSGTASGVQFTFTGVPSDQDQFTVAVNSHETQNILDTVSQLKASLNTPTNGDPIAVQKLQASLASGLANLASGTDQLSSALSSVGGRGSALDTQSDTNQSLALANTQTQSSIRDSDPAEVMTRLTLQQTMLQASQLAFSKIAQLGLFNKI